MAETEGKNPFNVWWAAAAGFLVLVVVGAVVLGFQLGRSGGGDDTTTAETAPPESPEPDAGNNETEVAGGGDRACGALSEDDDYPTEAPPTEWETYGSSTFTVPVSEEYGPLKRDGEVWECYARSPKGAVYAGLGLGAAFTAGGQYEAAVDTPQAEAAFEQEQQTSQSSYPAWSAFSIEEYSDTNARIAYYGEQGAAAGVFTVSVSWDESADDWRLDLTRPISFDEHATPDSFVQWER